MASRPSADNAWSDRVQRDADPSLPTDLEALMRDALDHLHDLPHLRRHPLALQLELDLDCSGERNRESRRLAGTALQQALLDGIEYLRPNRGVSPTSHAWRSHRLLSLRYVEGLGVAEVHTRLSISRREYYRDLRQAIQALAWVLEAHLAGGHLEDEAYERPRAVAARAARRTAREGQRAEEQPTQLGLPSEANATAGNLPLQLTSFVGRERELAEVKALLRTTRLLTLTGAGGSGKTRLAIEAAKQLIRECRKEYPDGVWTVALGALQDPSLLAQTVAFALGQRDVPNQTILETLLEHLASHRLLLLLDNCEHLVEALAQLVDALLRACPNLKVLTTSREALRIAGETIYQVPPLAVPDSEHLPSVGELVRYEGIRLFVERALAAAPGFELVERNAQAVVRICSRLDGLPLAIELAATRVRGLSVEQIASNLDRRFELLTTGSRAALPRQQTLRGTLDWSYDLLSDEEKAVLRRLAVFAGGWTLEAAEMVAAGATVESGQVLDLLLRLVDKSLVVAEPRAGEIRYHLLETIRQYALEKLAESGEAAEANDRQRDWYLRLAEGGATDDGNLLAITLRVLSGRPEGEPANLRAALDWCRAGADREAELRLASLVGTYWHDRGHLAEGRTLMADVLSRSGEIRGYARGLALLVAAVLEDSVGNPHRAKELAEVSLANLREVGGWIAAKVLGYTGFLSFCLGNADEGIRLAEEALAITRQSGRRSWIAMGSLQAGAMLHRLGRDAARPILEECLEGSRGVDDRLAAMALYFLAGVETAEGDGRRARELADEGLAILGPHSPTWMTALGLYIRGDVARAQDDYIGARADYASGVQIVHTSGHNSFVAFGLVRLAGLRVAEGQFERAACLLGAADAQYVRTHIKLSTNEHPGRERDLEATRGALGEEAFAQAWAKGQALTLEQAVEYALRDEV